jgi:multiple sugar transport system substrate-binding protein
MSKKTLRIASVCLLLVLALGAFQAVAQDKVTVTWFVGLGTGTREDQIAVQEQVVADFNASQSEIELVLNIAPSYDVGRDTISTLMAAGTPPDIVGPVGVGGSNFLSDSVMNIQPLVDAAGVDLSLFDPALVDLYRRGEGELVGLPFAVYPSATYYNEALFDEAGLNYPPQEYGAMYVMPDGTEVEWNYETVAEIAKILTVDANGNDATMEGFDPENIVQFGQNFQWARLGLMWTHIQPQDWYDEANNTITIPEDWYTASHWLQDALWTSHYYPNATYNGSDLLNNDNAFSSGNLGITIAPLWFTCCLDATVGNFEWDLAPAPRSLDGEHHVATDADTFYILEGSANPEAAFEALSFLTLGEAAGQLTTIYGAFPAHPDYRQPWLDSVNARYPMGVNWQIAVDALAYNNPGNMHHEAAHPNWQQGNDRVHAFLTLLLSDSGADVDVDAELATLEADLNTIVAAE